MSAKAIPCLRLGVFFLVALAYVLASGAEQTAEDSIQSLRLFSEPLVPIRKPSAEENQEIANAIRAFEQRAIPDDFSALEEFLAKNPESSWSPAVWVDYGLECFKSGWYSKALAAWEKAWPLLKSSADPTVKALGDRAAGELACMYGRLGRMAQLEALLKEVEGRSFVGPATEKIVGAREGLWTMQHRPEIGFRCGPMALDRILASQKSTNAGCALIYGSQSTTNGFALTEVAELSRQLGMDYQMAFRNRGAEFIVPAVVNWKVGHYAALVRREGESFLLQDPTFGNDTWASRRALEEETSGYFLVPSGELPDGWRAVFEEEGKKVFGKGSTNNKDNTSTTGQDKKKCDDKGGGNNGSNGGPYPYAGIRGMARANTHLMLVSLNIQDEPVGYSPPVGPRIGLTVTYNQREANQPGTFTYANLGPKWTFNWLAYIADNPTTPLADVNYFTEEGGMLVFSDFNTNNQTFGPQVKSQAILKRTSTNSYEMTFNNGAKVIFNQPDCNCSSRRVFMTQAIDPQGNAVTINYDSSFRITNVVDAIGQATTFSYEHPTDTRKLTKVTDPFGRFATFTYDGSGRLTNITDVIGMSSQVTYDGGDFITSMTTPYGTTRFEKGENGPQRWLITTYPNGEKDRVEFFESAVIGVPGVESVVPAGMNTANQYLIYRNSFYWDPKAYAEAPGDYTRAHLYHWLHFAAGVAAGVLESEKAPLENRVWYAYDGQSIAYNYGTTDQPNAIGRVLDDGTTQLVKFKYDSAGNVTNSIDPVGRSKTYVYSTNLVDLLEIRQTTGTNNDLVMRSVYNTQHLAVAIQNAAGQWTTNAYNARGQLTSTRNPAGEITTLTYDPNGYLTVMDGPAPGTNDALRLVYDSIGRLRSMIGPDGYAVTNNYDNLDRITNIAFPDGTFTAFTYDKLDLVKTRDREGRETIYTYDPLGRVTSARDPLNRTVRLEYCNCGALTALIDSQGRATRWEYDIQGRTTAKLFADGSRVRYTYENTTSRLKSVRDEKGQLKTFEYFADNSTKRVAYPIAEVATPSVTFTYDPNHGRMLTMSDTFGTTRWTYHPAGALGAFQVASIDGSWADDTITYQYDELGRATNRTINGVTQSAVFDSLGRVTSTVDPLGSSSFAYDGSTARLLDVTYPNGQTTHYDYTPNSDGARLQGITHRKADTSLISRFTYARNAFGNITNWVQELGTFTNNWSIGYDAADQLTNVVINRSGTNQNNSYAYDASGNRLSETVASTNRTFTYNALNQLVASSDTAATNTTYEWDGEHRLVAINSGANRTEFSYDGQGRRRLIVEKTNGVIAFERRYVWIGTLLYEERDASNNVLQRFFDEGFTRGGTNYFYTRDHLRSVREVTDESGQLQARYSYSPFGRPETLVESVKPPFGYTSHFQHGPSGLNLTYLRPLSTDLGRWLSRDPLAETQGANLYAYVGNDPINQFDPWGACSNSKWRNDLKEFIKNMLELNETVSKSVENFGKMIEKLGAVDNWILTGQVLNGVEGAADKFWQNLSRVETIGKWVEGAGEFMTGLDIGLKSLQAVNDPTLGNLSQAAGAWIGLHPVAGPSLQYGLNLGGGLVTQIYNWSNIIGGPGTADRWLLQIGESHWYQTAERWGDKIFNTPYY